MCFAKSMKGFLSKGSLLGGAGFAFGDLTQGDLGHEGFVVGLGPDDPLGLSSDLVKVLVDPYRPDESLVNGDDGKSFVDALVTWFFNDQCRLRTTCCYR